MYEASQSSKGCGEPGSRKQKEKEQFDKHSLGPASKARAGPTVPWPAPGHSPYHSRMMLLKLQS